MGRRKMVKRTRADKEEETDSGDLLLPTSPTYNAFNNYSLVPQDTTPGQPIYQTRSTKARLAKCDTDVTTPTTTPPGGYAKGTPIGSSNLRFAVRVSKEEKDQSNVETSNPSTESQGSKPLAKAATLFGILRDSGFADSKDTSNPASKNYLDSKNLCSNLIPQAEEGQQVQDPRCVVHACEKVDNVLADNKLHDEENIGSDIVGNRQEEDANENQKQVSQSTTINCTEIAALVADSVDIDEAESAANCALVTIGKYRVKEEVAEVFRSINLKYGDIAENCILETIEPRSSLVTIVCEVYQKVEQMNTSNINSKEIDTMLGVITDIESSRVKVGWLRKRLEDISASIKMFENYKSLKDTNARSCGQIERKKQEVQALQEELDAKKQKLQVLQGELTVMETEAKENNAKALDIRVKLVSFYQRPLVYGLL